jgi:hypothetical protein
MKIFSNCQKLDSVELNGNVASGLLLITDLESAALPHAYLLSFSVMAV